MRRALVLCALMLAGCATVKDYEAPLGRVTPAAVDIAKSPGCGTGNQACIDAVVAEMQRRYVSLAAACDHRAAFALMYLRVTDGVKQPDSNRFRDSAYLHRLDAQFARLYFRAFDAYQAGRGTDAAWRIAFDSAHKGQTTGLGDMLLGMNAHISNDLPFALVAAGMTEKGGRSARADFDAVNDLLGDVETGMIDEESSQLDPTVGQTTLPYLGVRGSEIATVIAGWRSEAWQNARKLLAAPPGPARAVVAEQIRASAAERARLIQAFASNRLLGGDARKRDEFCSTRGAGA